MEHRLGTAVPRKPCLSELAEEASWRNKTQAQPCGEGRVTMGPPLGRVCEMQAHILTSASGINLLRATTDSILQVG